MKGSPMTPSTIMTTTEHFPKYLMKVGEKRIFLKFAEAAQVYNSGTCNVSFGQYVLDSDFSVRKMEDNDRKKISRAADAYSASK